MFLYNWVVLLFKFKKADGGLTIVLVVVIIAVFLGWLVNLGSKECRSNSDCGNGLYCGSDFACHQIPIIEKTIVKNNLIWSSTIIGTAIIISALILKSKISSFLEGTPLIGKIPSILKKEHSEETKSHSQNIRTP